MPLSENKTIGSMTDRQRRALAALLREAGAAQSQAGVPEDEPAPALARALVAVG